jgi:hypothetical protein
MANIKVSLGGGTVATMDQARYTRIMEFVVSQLTSRTPHGLNTTRTDINKETLRRQLDAASCSTEPFAFLVIWVLSQTRWTSSALWLPS